MEDAGVADADADVADAADVLSEPAVEAVARVEPLVEESCTPQPWWPRELGPFPRGSSELDVPLMYDVILLAEALRALPVFELIELQGIGRDGGARADALSLNRVHRLRQLLVLLGVERERIRIRGFGAACNPHRRDWSSVRIRVIRYDGRDLVSEGATDLFGGCGLDSHAAEVPLSP